MVHYSLTYSLTTLRKLTYPNPNPIEAMGMAWPGSASHPAMTRDDPRSVPDVKRRDCEQAAAAAVSCSGLGTLSLSLSLSLNLTLPELYPLLKP